MEFLVSQLLVLLTALVGLVVWSWSDMPLAWREIAINTRKDPAQGSSYPMLKVFAACLKIFAVLTWGLGIAAVVTLVVTGYGFDTWVEALRGAVAGLSRSRP